MQYNNHQKPFIAYKLCINKQLIKKPKPMNWDFYYFAHLIFHKAIAMLIIVASNFAKWGSTLSTSQLIFSFTFCEQIWFWW